MGAQKVLAQLDRDLVGLAPVKARIGEIASLLLVDRARARLGLTTEPPTLHMSFTGNPGTGKTTVALRMAEILHQLGYIRQGHLVAVTRDDLVGQYIGRPENERDYGQEAIEILLQAMEEHRDDLVVIVAGYRDRMEQFFRSNPGLHSRIAHHIEFPDYREEELLAIGDQLLERQGYRFSPAAREAFARYVSRRARQPHFSNARSVRNALDRFRLRQASRLVARGEALSAEDLATIEPEDVLASRVFREPDAGAAGEGPGGGTGG